MGDLSWAASAPFTCSSDVAKGVKNFKKGMAEEDAEDAKPSARIEAKSSADPAFDRDGNRVREPLREER